MRCTDPRHPVYLLDDIFGELDPARRNALMAALPADAQKLVTTTSVADSEFIRAGKHVIVEKPMATTLKDADLLIAACAAPDRPPAWQKSFGYTTGAPVAVVSEPLDASDQVACIEGGVPAVQLFTGPTPDYHRPSDSVDRIYPEGMVVVTEAAHEAVAYLAERVDPLTVTIRSAPGP